MANDFKSDSNGEDRYSDYFIDINVPEKPVLYPGELFRDSKFRIKDIQGVYYISDRHKEIRHWVTEKLPLFSDCVGVNIVLEKINDGSEECLMIGISDKRICCEEYGAMSSEDDLSHYLGSELLEVYFTDSALNTKNLESILCLKDRDDCHMIRFINVKTDRGTFQITVYNCHNGYYGHDIFVTLLSYGDIYKETRV